MKDATVDDAETSMGKVFGKGFNVNSISGRDGVEMIDSRAGRVKSSMGILKAENCQVGDVKAREDVKIKNCSGNNLKSSMGKVLAISEKQGAERFNLIEARDGVDLKRVSSKTVRSSMGAVNCVGGDFDLVVVSKPSSLKQANINQLQLNVGKDEELTINLADSMVNLVAIKVTEATSTTMVIGGSNVFNFGGSSKCISGRNIIWSLNGSSLTASPNSFLVEGSLLSKFKSEISSRCSIGTRGMVNGLPAQVTSSGVQIQKEPVLESKESSKELKTRTKVTFIGGKIIGNIVHDAPVNFDLSKTTFEGEFVS